MSTLPPEAQSLGDNAVTIRLGTERSPALLARIHDAARLLAAANLDAIEDIVPAYLSLTVFYDSLRRNYSDVAAAVTTICRQADGKESHADSQREHVIPTRYDGVDLSAVAAMTKLSTDEVIARHTSRSYSVDILGFVPGFAYMSELDDTLALPRREQPRPRVAAGSVAIAGVQTAIYPLATPGGWHIIGTTDAVIFDPQRAEPALFRAGDTVRFESVR